MGRSNLAVCRGLGGGRRRTSSRSFLLATLMVVHGVAYAVLRTEAQQERAKLLVVVLVFGIAGLKLVGLALDQGVVGCRGTVGAG